MPEEQPGCTILPMSLATDIRSYQPFNQQEASDREVILRQLETDLRLHHQPKTVSLHVGGRTFILPIADILYAESREHGTVLHTIHGEQFLPCSLSQTEESLPAENFCRCHNSFLVNFSHIREVSGRTVYLLEDGEVSIGRRYMVQFQNRFVRYLNRI